MIRFYFYLLFLSSVSLKSQELLDISKQAYIYAYPLVLTGVTRDFMLQKIPINKFYNMREFPTDKFTDIVRPNVDTLYSTAWLDLSNSPIVLSVPDTNGRYYLMEIMDAWTNVFESIGKRTTGTKAQRFVLVGPNWSGQVSGKYKKFIKSPTNFVWILGRTQTNGKKDYDFVHKIQDGYKLTVLNSIENTKKDFKQKSTISPAQQVENMDAKTFFTRFVQELKSNPPLKQDKDILDKLANIGILIGKDFDSNKLPKDIDVAITNAKKEMQQNIIKLGKNINGWGILTDIGVYGTDYLKRAIVALIGVGANLPKDAIYPTAFVDYDGKNLNGKNKYVIHFNKKDIPPVNAFWSITLYNSKNYLVANSINRYALGDRDDLQFNKDGSLDIYIQNELPKKDLQFFNWLPAPKDDFNLTLRLYWPKPSVLNGTWNPPGAKLVV